MENDFQTELVEAQAALEAVNLDELPGGLSSDLVEIASNVTYRKENAYQKSGPKVKSPGQMTLQDYEALSQQNKSYGPRQIGSDVNSLAIDFHGIQEIIEKDDASNDESVVEICKQTNTNESKLTGKKRRSPERIIRAQNANQQIPGMIESQTINVGDSGAGFSRLKEQVNN